MQKTNHLASIILRFGLAIMFLWFGLHQLITPSDWTSFVPAFINQWGMSPTFIVLLNGWLEIMGASLLIVGLFTAPAAFVLALHMAIIAAETRGAIGMRDFGLTVACLALSFLPPDIWTLDVRLKRNK